MRWGADISDATGFKTFVTDGRRKSHFFFLRATASKPDEDCV